MRNALYRENDDCIIFEVNCAELKLLKHVNIYMVQKI
nr:MAG TPA: hypothetical protein [Caudoviricetes sp.]